ncbi:MAG: DNA-binding response regulator, partial [Rhodocyclaceae bacterium]|nr:DNA-binding response regulator [Rhodocyclaceae bacterium]
NVSIRTVEVHRSRVFEKMGARSAVDLARIMKDYKGRA